MKKRPTTKARTVGQDLLAEYEFDYERSKPNRFATSFTGNRVAVVLEPDVAAVFTTSESVNTLLRSVISAVSKPKPRTRPRKKTVARSNQPSQPTGSARG